MGMICETGEFLVHSGLMCMVNNMHRSYFKIYESHIFMASLRSSCGYYIFSGGFVLLSFFLLFSLPNLSGRRTDVYHTSTHDVALVQI